MNIPLLVAFLVTATLLVSGFSEATSLSSGGPVPNESLNPPPKPSAMTKSEIVKSYVSGCKKKSAMQPNCEQLRKDTIEIIKEDLYTVGSSAKRENMPTILKFFKSNEVVIRIAVADAVGMLGAQDSDADLLIPLANDPVPDVRMAVGQAVSRGKGSALNLLGKRIMAFYPGATPDIPPDPGKLPVPVLPQSTYLYYASDPAAGRVSYIAKDLNDAATFYKGKAKKGPFKLEEFQEKYRWQLGDEDRAKSHAAEAESAKQNESLKSDPANMQATMDKLLKTSSVQGKRTSIALNDLYQAPMFDKPTVYILEERQIGNRTYPTRYAVLYQDVTLKRPGYRLSWMTLPDEAIKTAQAETLKDEQQEATAKKRQEAVDELVKKKDDTEKKKFKKGQADLEKELGF